MIRSNYPVGFWNYMSMDDFREEMLKDWEEAGFSLITSPLYQQNTVHRKKLKIILEWCKTNNVKIILNDSRVNLISVRIKARNTGKVAQLDDDYAKRVQEAIGEFEQYNEVYGFHIIDEPEWNEYDTVIKAANIIKRHTNRIIPYINLLPDYKYIVPRIKFKEYENYLQDYVERTDGNLLSYDCYTQMEEGKYEGHSNYFKNLNHYKNCSLKNNIDFWNIVLAIPCLKFRKPSYDDLRWQVNTSLAYGAKGLQFFIFYAPKKNWGFETNYRGGAINCWGERTQTFYDLKDVIRELHNRWGDTFMQLNLKKVSHYPDKPTKEAQLFDGKDIVSEIIINNCDKPAVIISEFDDKSHNSEYIFVVNGSQMESVHLTIRMKKVGKIFRYSMYGEEYEINFDKKNKDFSETELWLAPGQGELLKTN